MNWKAGIEIVHPESEAPPVGALLRDKGQHIFTVVFEVEDIGDAKTWVLSQGFEIIYAFDKGSPEKAATIKRISISPERTHGKLVTLVERVGREPNP